MSFVEDLSELVAANAAGVLSVASHWQRAALGSVASVINGFAFPSRHFKASKGVPLVRIRDVVDGQSDTLYDGPIPDGYWVNDGDLLVGMDGDFNCALWRGGKALLNQRVCKIVPDETRLRKQFLLYVLPGYLKLINDYTSSVTVKHLSSRTLQQLPLPLPKLAEQDRLIARIDALFAEIDEGEAALAEARAGVETYRKALLKAAVTGELTADWRAANPPQETGEQLLARILADRRANGHVVKKSQAGELVAEDDLPMLPDGWIWCRNEQAGMIQLGRQRTPKDHDGPHMRPYLRVANVYEERIDLRDVKQMNFTPVEFETFELKSGDILLNEGQSLELVGRPAMFRGEVEGCCFQNTLVRFRAGPHVDGEYALLTFLYAMHTKRFQRIAKITTNIAHLGAGRFAEIGFPLAPLAEQREVVRLYRVHMMRFAEAISTLSETSALRQSILAAAFRGELAA